jgi:transposase
MFELNADLAVYLYRDPVDFRKSVNGLSALVEQGWGLDPFAPSCFVFGNRRRDKIKLLVWHNNGFWLLYKRLEQDRFVWPRAEDAVLTLTVEQLHWLLDGIDLAALRGHHSRAYRRAS